MTTIDKEEKSPLLFVVDEDIPLRSRYFEGGRFNGITTGATTVFTHFPNYIGTCWVTTAVSALIFFMMLLLVLSTITAASFKIPRCVATEELNNQTIHLVHIHKSHKDETEKVNFIKDILSLYPSHTVRLIVITDEYEGHQRQTTPKPTEKQFLKETSNKEVAVNTIPTTSKKQKLLKRRSEMEDTQLLLNMLLHAKLVDDTEPRTTSAPTTIKTTTTKTTTKPAPTYVEDLVQQYPKLLYKNVTYAQLFSESPLMAYYFSMSEQLKVFSVRVLQIWQYGGISFDLESTTNYLKDLTSDEIGKNSNFIINEKNVDNEESSDTVNVNEKTLYMESRVPCHAFFGQILMILRKSNEHSTPKEVMKRAVKSFCRHYFNNLDYCKKFLTI